MRILVATETLHDVLKAGRSTAQPQREEPRKGRIGAAWFVLVVSERSGRYASRRFDNRVPLWEA